MFWYKKGIGMKKYIIGLSLLFVIVPSIHSMSESRRMKSLTIVAAALKNASTKLFGNIRTSTMFEAEESPITQTGLDSWNATITQLRGLVAKYNVKKKPIFNVYFSQLDGYAESLISAVKITYNMMFSSNATEKMRVKNRPVLKPIFQKLITEVNEVAITVGNADASGFERAAYDILFQYALTLERVAKAAIEGIDFAR